MFTVALGAPAAHPPANPRTKMVYPLPDLGTKIPVPELARFATRAGAARVGLFIAEPATRN